MFSRLACSISHVAGRPAVFGVALVLTLLGSFWSVWSQSEGFLDLFNLGISVASILLLFLLQGSSNRDTLAVQAKLDEIIRALDEADDKFREIDKQSEEQIELLRSGGA